MCPCQHIGARPAGCGGGGGSQILRVAGNILNKEQRTFDKGFPPVWWLGVLLIMNKKTANCVTEYLTNPGAGADPLEGFGMWKI